MALINSLLTSTIPHGGWIANAATNGVGVPGGIPSAGWTEVLATGLDPTGVTECWEAIKTQGLALSTNQVLKIPAGTYKVSQIMFHGNTKKDNFVLRGSVDSSGYPTTTFVASGGGSMGSSGDYGWAVPDVADSYITNMAAMTKGQTVIPVTNGSLYPDGSLIQFFFANDESIPVISVSGGQGLRRQMALVVSKSGNNLTITPPLLDNFSTCEFASVRVATQVMKNSGFEDFIYDMETGSGIGMVVSQTYGCWMKNVIIKRSNNYNMIVQDNLNFEMLGGGSLDLKPPKLANHFGIAPNACTRCLFSDVVVYNCFPGFEINQGTIGCAFTFCYVDDAAGKGLQTNHSAHNSMNLYEGCIASGAQNDGYHGSSHGDTFFRTWMMNREPLGAYGFFTLNRFANYQNVVGCVLNSPGTPHVDGFQGNGNPNLGSGSFDGHADLGLGDPQIDFNLTGTVVSLPVYNWTAFADTNEILINELLTYLVQGSQIKLDVTSGAAGITSGNIYYVAPASPVLPLDGNGEQIEGEEVIGLVRIKIASSAANAISDPPVTVDITSNGSGTTTGLAAVISMPGGIGQIHDGGDYGFGGESNTVAVTWDTSGFTGKGRSNCSVHATTSTSITLRPWRVTTGDLFENGKAVRVWHGNCGFQELDDMVARTLNRVDNYVYSSATAGYDIALSSGDTLVDSLAYPTGAPSWWPEGYVFPPIDSHDLNRLSLSSLPAAARFIANDPPLYSGSIIQMDGTTLVIAFTKPIEAGVDGFTGFDLEAGDVSLTYVSGSGTASLTFNIVGRAMLEGEIANLVFVAPTDGAKAVDNGILLSSFPNKAVGNNSTVTGGASYYIGTDFSETNADIANSFAGYAFSCPITIPEAGLIQKLRVYCVSVVSIPSKLAVYHDNGTLLASVTTTMNGEDKWISVDITSVPVTEGQIVHFAANFFGNGEPVMRGINPAPSGSTQRYNEPYDTFPASTQFTPRDDGPYAMAFGMLLVPTGTTVAAPVFSPTAGTYTTTQNVTITCETAESDIYYTTNGTTPTSSSTPYTGAISVSSTTTIKAIAIVDTSNSTVATAVFTIGAAPTAPSGLTATAISTSQINLAWDDNSGNETGFKIYRGTVSGSLSLIHTTSSGVTTYSNTSLSASTQYFYKISATNAIGDSAQTSEVNATTSAVSGTPDKRTPKGRDKRGTTGTNLI